MSEEEDEFQGVIIACLSVLLLGCETRLDAALAQMARMPWSTLEAVSTSMTDSLSSATYFSIPVK